MQEKLRLTSPIGKVLPRSLVWAMACICASCDNQADFPAGDVHSEAGFEASSKENVYNDDLDTLRMLMTSSDSQAKWRGVTRVRLAGRGSLELIALCKEMLLKDNDKFLRKEAADALVSFGAQAIPTLMEALAVGDAVSQKYAIRALGRFGEKGVIAVPRIAALLRSPGLTSCCAIALGRIGTPALAALPEIKKAVENAGEDPSVLFSLEYAMLVLQPEQPESRQRAIDLLRDPRVQESARSDIEAMGARLAVIPVLVKALEYEGCGESAAGVLGEMPECLPVALPALLIALKSRGTDIRASVARALGKIGKSQAAVARALGEAMEDPDGGVRSEVADSLRGLGSAKRAAIPSLLKSLDNSDHDIRFDGMSVIGEVVAGEPQVVDKVGSILADASNSGALRAAAARSLRESGKQGLSYLLGVLETTGDRDEDEDAVREACIECMLAFGGEPRAVMALARVVQEGTRTLQSAAISVLGQLGPDAKAAIPALDSVRGALESEASRAIRRIRGLTLAPDAR